ncbi:LGFP repeat-containing protein [Micromonospora sp. DT81.3]
MADDQHWNSDPASRNRVMARIAAAHANTVVMSYWGDMPKWSPMALDGSSLPGVLGAAEVNGLVIMPAIEGGSDPKNPRTRQWQFATDFPSPSVHGQIAPGLIARIGRLFRLFHDKMHLWAQLYDHAGEPRYAVQLLHVWSSLPETTDAAFAAAFTHVAKLVEEAFGIRVGFCLDVIGLQPGFMASPHGTGADLRAEPAVLAINGFQSEVFSDKVLTGPKMGPPVDNNASNLETLADWKRSALLDWAATGIPVLLDVSNGMDGRYVWREVGSGFWGDNRDYTEDRWRNWVSQLKGPAIAGITVDTWNGYTEGYAAVPSFEHGDVVTRWLADLLEPDPRHYSHMHYRSGAATHRVYGAICQKWVSLGADRGFGFPTSDEIPALDGRVSYFSDDPSLPQTPNKAIYWSEPTGAHEIHGWIARTYWDLPDQSRLGLPIDDQSTTGIGAISRFARGTIEWFPGQDHGHITYSP